MKDKFAKYGKPWWKNPERKYVRKEATDIIRTFKQMGWVPPSEKKNEESMLGVGR